MDIVVAMTVSVIIIWIMDEIKSYYENKATEESDESFLAQEYRIQASSDTADMSYAQLRLHNTQKAFKDALDASTNEMQILKALKRHLLRFLEQFWDYERERNRKKFNFYENDSYMSSAINKLKSYNDEQDLVSYCAKLLDAFSPEHESLQIHSIIETEIKKIDKHHRNFSSKVQKRRETTGS